MASLLLIHGAWHGPWCWEAFAGRLRERGHDVRTARLRGHDGQPGRIWYRLHDYLDDVEHAAAEFDRPPILVGHSMGGLLAQKHLERSSCPGAVLMASIPIHGVIGAVLRLAARHPIAFLQANALLRLRPLVSTSTLVRDLFFSTETAESVVADCQARLQDESYLVFLDLVFHRVRVRLQRIDAPVLVLGAEHDGFFTARELGRTARAYGTEARMFQGMGHDMMLDQGWEEVADLIDTWARDSTVEPLGPEKSEGREQATTDS